MHRVVDVGGGVVGHARLHSGREFVFDLLELDASALDHVNGVCVRQYSDTHEDGALLRIAHFGIVVLGAEHHVGDVT